MRVLITGANQGLGFQLCRLLVRDHLSTLSKEGKADDLEIVMACRDKEKAVAAILLIVQEFSTGTGRASESAIQKLFGPVLYVDFTDAETLDQCHAEFQAKYGESSSSSSSGNLLSLEEGAPLLDVLVNNAAINESLPDPEVDRTTARGFSQVLLVNYHNTVAFTEKFLPFLRQHPSPSSPTTREGRRRRPRRVIMMGSRVGVNNFFPKGSIKDHVLGEVLDVGEQGDQHDEEGEKKETTRDWLDQPKVTTPSRLAAIGANFSSVLSRRDTLREAKKSEEADACGAEHWPSGKGPLAYGVSKLLLHAWTRHMHEEELAMKAIQEGAIGPVCVQWVMVTPGYCQTNMTGGKGFKTAEEGADTPFWVVADKMANFSGGFFGDRAELSFNDGTALPQLADIGNGDRELTDEELTVVAKILESPHAGDENDVVVKGPDYLYELSSRDLRTLSGATWLNDQVINAYFKLIELHCAKKVGCICPKVRALSSHFYSKLVGASGSLPSLQDIKRWTKRPKSLLTDSDILLLPVHQPHRAHWVLVVLDLVGHQLGFHDSLNSVQQGDAEGNKVLDGVATVFDLLRADHLTQEGGATTSRLASGPPMKEWRRLISGPKGLSPQQQNGFDCGVFVLFNGLYFSGALGTISSSLPFTQRDIKQLRLRAQVELCQGGLLQK